MEAIIPSSRERRGCCARALASPHAPFRNCSTDVHAQVSLCTAGRSSTLCEATAFDPPSAPGGVCLTFSRAGSLPLAVLVHASLHSGGSTAVFERLHHEPFRDQQCLSMTADTVQYTTDSHSDASGMAFDRRSTRWTPPLALLHPRGCTAVVAAPCSLTRSETSSVFFRTIFLCAMVVTLLSLHTAGTRDMSIPQTCGCLVSCYLPCLNGSFASFMYCLRVFLCLLRFQSHMSPLQRHPQALPSPSPAPPPPSRNYLPFANSPPQSH